MGQRRHIQASQEPLSREVEQLGLALSATEGDAVIDTPVLVHLRRQDERPTRRKPPSEEYLLPEEFIHQLSRGKKLAVSQATLWEFLDPRSRPDDHPNRSRSTLSLNHRDLMYSNLSRLKELGIGVLPVTEEIFDRAMDLWFLSRQGMFEQIHDAGLIDPIIAATAIVRGVPLYSTNAAHFEPYVRLYHLNFKHILQDKPFLALPQI